MRPLPYQRLLADPRTPDTARRDLEAVYATLDPVQLLSDIRHSQARLVEIDDQPVVDATAAGTPTLEQFLANLRAAWHTRGSADGTPEGEEEAGRRRPDPFVAVTAEMRSWFDAKPWRTSGNCSSASRQRIRESFPMANYGRYSGGSRIGAGSEPTRWCSAR